MISHHRAADILSLMVCTTSLAVYLISLINDEWLVRIDINNNKKNLTIQSLGIWSICPTLSDEERHYLNGQYCFDPVNLVKYSLQKNSFHEPQWIHLTRFLLVSSILTSAFSFLAALSAVITSSTDLRPAMPLNICSTVLLLPVIVFILPEGRLTLKDSFIWGTSVVAASFGVSFNFVAIGFYVTNCLHKRCRNKMQNTRTLR